MCVDREASRCWKVAGESLASADGGGGENDRRENNGSWLWTRTRIATEKCGATNESLGFGERDVLGRAWAENSWSLMRKTARYNKNGGKTCLRCV